MAPPPIQGQGGCTPPLFRARGVYTPPPPHPPSKSIPGFTSGCTVRCISVKIEPVFGNVTASSAIRCIFQKVLERNNHALNSVFISVKPLSFAVHRAAFHYSRVNFNSVGKRSYRRCIVFCRIDTDAYQFFLFLR